MTTLTRAECIEETKAIIDEEIDRLRILRETETDAEKWLKLDNDIDALLIMKDNVAAMIDAKREPFDRDDRDILAAARKVSPAAVLTSGEMANAAYMRADHAITTLQQLADAREASFNRHYYGNPDGKAKFAR